ncbi:MAG: transposase [Lachnospiraceae bacterium]|nr:transposase [Lachnospiraceae bacterium]MBF1013084.1 transposase [Lachnospiraceae bacterium]MBF1026995.1 transposase [Lachnospiraceae bacterium]
MKDRGTQAPKLVISDVNKGLVLSVKQCFSGASWQR